MRIVACCASIQTPFFGIVVYCASIQTPFFFRMQMQGYISILICNNGCNNGHSNLQQCLQQSQHQCLDFFGGAATMVAGIETFNRARILELQQFSWKRITTREPITTRTPFLKWKAIESSSVPHNSQAVEHRCDTGRLNVPNTTTRSPHTLQAGARRSGQPPGRTAEQPPHRDETLHNLQRSSSTCRCRPHRPLAPRADE